MTKKIKVCFVQGDGYAVFNPESGAKIGGAEVDLFNISTELAKDKNYKVYFLVADYLQKDLEIYNGVYVVKGYSKEKSVKNYIMTLVKFYRTIARIDADIYLTANLSKYVGLTNFFCRLFNKIHIHRTEHQNQVNKSYILKKIRKRSTKYLLFFLGFIKVDHIVVQNEEDRINLKKTYNFPSTVIKNSYLIKKKIDQNKSIILWVARGEKWKRPEVFIQLANEFPNEKFVMIMPSGNNQQFFNSIKSEAKKLKNLEFIPGVPFSKVESYYNRAKIFVNTSISEGFPNSFNQSMNASTPILSLNINPDNFIVKNKVGIYCNDNFSVLKSGLNQLLNDRDLWKNFSENAYKYVYNEMNIEKTIKLWKKIFLYLYNKRYRSN